MSPREYPDRSSRTESTIESSKPDSTGVSSNISRISSSVPDLICHWAIAKPGLFAGINCDESISPHKRVSARANAHMTRTRPLPQHPGELCIFVCEYARTGRITVSIQNHKKNRLETQMYSLSGPANFSHSLHFNFLRWKTIRGL